MKRGIAWIVIPALVAMAVAGRSDAADAKTRLLSLKSPCVDFAINPDTGDVIGVDANANTVTLYPRAYFEGKDRGVVGPVTLGDYPYSVTFKRYKGKTYFLVGCRRDGNIHVLDPKTLKVVKKIPLSAPKVSSLVSPTEPDNPFVYYALGKGYGRAARVRVDTFKDEGDLGINEDVKDLAVSADGGLLYTRGPHSPSGFEVYKQVRDESSGTASWQQLYREHDSKGRYLPGPFNRYTAAGKGIYTAGLRKRVCELEAEPVCFFPDRPLIVCFDKSGLVGVSYNSLKVLRRVNLPSGFTDTGNWTLPDDDTRYRDRFYRNRHSNYALRVLPDPDRSRMVVAYGSRAFVVPVGLLGVSDEPVLIAFVDAPETVGVGRKVDIPLKPFDKRVVVSLKDGPAGVRLSGNKLTWTPRGTQVGPATITLQLKHKDTTRTQSITVSVTQDSIRFGFSPAGIDISPSGRWAVAWNNPARRNVYAGQPSQSQRSRIALIDVDKRRVLIEKELLYAVSTAAVDDRYVYVAPSHSDRVNALSHKDLTRQKHSLTSGSVQTITLISPKLMAVKTQKGMATFSLPEVRAIRTVLSSPDLGDKGRDEMRWRMEREMRMRVSRGQAGDTSSLRRFRDGWYAAGAFFNNNMTKTRMLVSVSGPPTLQVSRQSRLKTPMPWDRFISNKYLMSQSGQQIGLINDIQTAILTDHPVTASLSLSDGRNGRLTARLTFRELLSAESVEQVTLFDESLTAGGRSSYERLRTMRSQYGIQGGQGSKAVPSVGKTVLALVGNRCFVHALSDATFKKCATPFEFEPSDDVLVINPARGHTIRHTLRGGTKPFEFELTTNHKGLSIDVKTGTVTVDGPQVFKDATELLMGELQHGKSGPGMSTRGQVRTATPRQLVNVMAKKIKDRYKDVTGSAPKGIPVLLPIGVTASDKNQQVTSMDYQVVVQVPDDTVLQAVTAILEKRRAEEDARRKEAERRRLEYEKRRLEIAKTIKTPTKTSGSTQERIQVLEERLRILEAKIDMLIRLLQDRERREAPAPKKGTSMKKDAAKESYGKDYK